MSKQFTFSPKLDFAIERVHRRAHATRLGSVDETGASQGVVHAQVLERMLMPRFLS